MPSMNLLLLAAVAFNLVSASPLSQLFARQAPSDPFYTPPSGFGSKPKGAILKQRKIGTTLINANIVPRKVEAYQLLYRTQDTNGAAIATVTTVFIPDFPQNNNLISFQTPYDSAWSGSDPSLSFYANNTPIGVFDQAKLLLIEAYLGNGYITSVPDYEGPDAAFGAGPLEGMNTLDGMRALGTFANSLKYATATPNYVGIGYSGGGIATGFAASLQKSYASDLNIKAWISGGTPANLTATLLFLDGGKDSGFGPVGVAGLLKSSAYGPQLSSFFKSIITPLGQSTIDYASTHSSSDSLANYANKSILVKTWQSLGNRLLYTQPVAGILQKLTLGTATAGTPVVPVYLYHASNDEVIPYGPDLTLDNAWCAQGVSVTFTTYASGGHITTAIYGLGSTVQYAKKAFAGTIPTGCSKSTVATNVIDKAALGGLEALATSLADLGRQAGST